MIEKLGLELLVVTDCRTRCVIATTKTLSKTVSQKEQDLLDIINDAKEKLHKLRNKQRIELGDLACKYKLNEFDLSIVENEFKELASKLSHGKK